MIIAYFHDGMFPNSVPEFFPSVRAARLAFRTWADHPCVCWSQASAALYAGDAADVALAEEYSGTGCPFGYPSWLLETGPRGGVRVTRA